MRACLTFVLIAAWLHATASHAHSGPVEPRTLRPHPDGGPAQLMATSFGLVQALDGAAWDVICSEAIGYDEMLEPILHWAPDGTVFVGSLKGLFVSRDGACSWSAHPDFTERGVADITPSPTAPDTVYVASGKFGADNGLFRSDDNGQTFTPVLTRADTFFTGIRFAPSMPGHAYASAWYFSPPTATIFRTDDGAQFTEATPTTPFISGFSVIAVSPADVAQVFASAYDSATNEYVLLRSADEGATFVEVARDAKAFRDVVFSPDGVEVWATAARLFVSGDSGATFVLSQATQRSFCAARQGESLLICADQRFDGYALGEWIDGGVEERMSFRDVRGPLDCPVGTPTHDVCLPIWPALQVALFVPPAGDGGTSGDAGSPDGGAAPDAGSADGGGGAGGGGEEPVGCGGCGAAGGGGWAPLLGLLIGAAALRRRRALPVSIAGLSIAAVFASVLVGCSPVPPGPPCEDCAPADPCDPNPCMEPNRSRCEAVEGRAECGCDEGTIERDGACVVPDPCSPNPCIRPHETVCTDVDGAAVCGCEPGYEPAANGCREIIDCANQHATGDAFEPDECPELARDIGTSGAQAEAHTVGPANDEDWFRLEATAGRIYRLRAAGPGAPPLRANVYLGDALDPVGPERTTSIDTEALDFALKSPSGGPLYFRVRAQDPVSTGDYEVGIGDLGTDDHGDDVGFASSVPHGTILTGSLQFDGDVDVLTFTPPEPGHAWELRVESSPGGPELRLDLLRGMPPASVRPGASETTVILTRAATAEPQYVRIDTAAAGFGFDWAFIAVDLGSDDHGDVLFEATPVTPSTGSMPPPVPANLDRAGDTDVFEFEAIAKHIYRFTCTPSGFADCDVTLRYSTGAEVVSDLDGGLGEVTHEFAVGGTVYVHVQAPGGGVGAYTYLLEDLGLDDHGDDPNTATMLGMPPVMGKVDGTARIETSGDRDFLRFTADGDHIYRISCTRQTLGDCVVRVFNLAGLPVAQDANGGDGLTYYEFLGGGDYYVELSTLGAQTGAMSWEILDLFHDDHGDDAVAATGMLANSAWVAGEVQLPGDKDFFRFNAVAGTQYRITCQRQSLGDCHLRLYDPGNALLDSDLDGGDAVLLRTATTSGFHALQVNGGAQQLGTFLVKIEDLGP